MGIMQAVDNATIAEVLAALAAGQVVLLGTEEYSDWGGDDRYHFSVVQSLTLDEDNHWVATTKAGKTLRSNFTADKHTDDSGYFSYFGHLKVMA